MLECLSVQRNNCGKSYNSVCIHVVASSSVRESITDDAFIKNNTDNITEREEFSLATSGISSASNIAVESIVSNNMLPDVWSMLNENPESDSDSEFSDSEMIHIIVKLTKRKKYNQN